MTIGYAMCGSFCTLADSMQALRELSTRYDILPILSEITYSTDTRFGKAEDFIREIRALTGHDIIHTIPGAEPIGPGRLLDALIVAPCTGNTLGKLNHGITDTSVTMAVKATLRGERPVILCIATNDALAASYANIGGLSAKKNLYFVPYRQDDPVKKSTSLIADFTKIQDTLTAALEGRQLQPVLLPAAR